MPYMVTFTINIPQMLPYMAYMDPMGTITSNPWLSNPPPFSSLISGILPSNDLGGIRTRSPASPVLPTCGTTKRACASMGSESDSAWRLSTLW